MFDVSLYKPKSYLAPHRAEQNRYFWQSYSSYQGATIITGLNEHLSQTLVECTELKAALARCTELDKPAFAKCIKEKMPAGHRSPRA